MKRIDFIKKFAVGGSILLTAPVLLNSCSDKTTPEETGGGNPNAITIDLSLAEYSELSAVGGFAYKGDIII